MAAEASSGRIGEAPDSSWTVAVPGHQPLSAGEHPRLLYRRSELAALREKAASPEGQAILRRLRFLLDGADGETMTERFNPAEQAYPERTEDLPAGTYTFGHAAGYGLLYQVTGDARFAEYGRLCFERALAGVRDRDSRYGFRRPGGALRAGPVLGWMAVGYDLCHGGWDEATRETLGRALFDYREEVERRNGTLSLTLESLARGTMPPGSNHFGMQVGGAALVLLAVTGEPWIDQDEVDRLMPVVEHSLVRNLREGFGDGGFFAEGDGTGSMASQIAFLTALQAWRNVTGRDFIHAPRPNVRMLTLKWIYQTVFREGQPDFWPARGGYPHNVWAREGLSGAGYFAIGFGVVREDERTALLWCYDRFLAAADEARGAPFDTASLHPQLAVSAFVNWPVGLRGVDPAAVLPRAYRDSTFGFYCWRNRWQDGSDTVITLLTRRSKGGYMHAPADTGLCLNTRGRHLTWGRVAEGPERHWWCSPGGEVSSLTLADGTCFAVDFTGASGADVMLVTSGTAEGLAAALPAGTLTFFFPTVDTPPAVTVVGESAVVGHQRVTLESGNLRLHTVP